MTDLPTAWAFGPYKLDMGGATAHYREKYACRAIKRELNDHGYNKVTVINDKIGKAASEAILDFQGAHGLVQDGEAGPMTCRELFRARVEDNEDRVGIPRHWLAAHGEWESGHYDPGAELINADGSRDRGLFQDNDQHGPYKMTDDEAFDPRVSIEARANALGLFASLHLGEFCFIQDTKKVRKFWAFPISVSSFRSPVGAKELVEMGDDQVVIPMRPKDQPGYPDTIDWAQACAYYVLRINETRRVYWS